MSQTSALAAKPSLYFVNKWIDYGAIGGVSIVAFLLFTLFHDGKMDRLYPIAAFLTIICNHPHFCATNFRMYHSTKNIMQFPLTALFIPVVIFIGMMASMTYPETVAPYFVKLFVLWSPYHFSGQSVGITMIYARRSGFKVGKAERYAFSGFIFLAFITTLLTYDTSTEPIEYYGMTYPSLGLPTWMVTVSKIAMYGFGITLLALVAKWCIQNKRMVPPIVLLPAVTHYVWFLGGTNNPGFQEFVPFFHSAQYMLIAWTVQLRESLEAKGVAPSKRFVVWQTARWMAICMAGGYAMFELLPYLFPIAKTNLVFVTGIVAAAVQMHHFFVDGVIWKLKTQTNVSPVLSNFFDFWRTEDPGTVRDLQRPLVPSGVTA